MQLLFCHINLIHKACVAEKSRHGACVRCEPEAGLV